MLNRLRWSVMIFTTVLYGCDGGSSSGTEASGVLQTAVAAIGGGAGAATGAVPPPAGLAGRGDPVVFNATDSARPGDIVTLQGANFGRNPIVRLGAGDDQADLPLVNRVDDWVAVRIPLAAKGALTVRVVDGARSSAPVKLNAAKALHMDSLQIASGGTFRIFGRNLQLPGSAAIVSIAGRQAAVQAAASDEHVLTVVAPAGLEAGPAAVTVDNGNGSGASVAERTVEVLADVSGDPLSVGVGWTGVFSPLFNRVVQVPCAGGNVSQPVQQAVDALAARGGGVVQLGAGVCTLDAGIAMRDNIVLQGAGKVATVVQYSRNYPIWAEKLTRIALRNLTLMNRGAAEEGPLLKGNRQIVLQNLGLRAGTQKQSFLTENAGMVVTGCDFVQAGTIGGQSPYLLTATRGLVFTGNSTRLMSGTATFERVSDAYIADNSFVRDTAAQQQPGALHMMTIDFATRIAVVGNQFATSDGPITNKGRNDGEAILTEGGGPNRTEYLGTVAYATATGFSDPSLRLRTDPFGDGAFPANYGVAIVAGTGAGQTRYVTAYANGQVTVDRAWDVVPDATSRYATFVWGLEKSILKNNQFRNMPRGIWLYQAAIRDIDVVGNTFHDGGGIYLRAYQNIESRMFDPIYNIRIAGNQVRNRTAEWMSYIAAVFVNSDARAFGLAITGVTVRDNLLVSNSPNLSSSTEEYAGAEGYFNMMRVENYGLYEPMATPRVLGTIFQSNSCSNCSVAYRLGTGAGGTVIDRAASDNASRLLDNWKTTIAADLATDTVIN